MQRGSFIFDGVESETVKAMIQARPIIEAPARKVSWKSVYGTDGDVPFDEGAYSNTSLDLAFFIDGDDLISDRQKFYNLLDGRGMYKSFIPYFDPDKIYRVMLSDKISFHNQHFYGERQQATAKFTVKPYKYLIDSPPVVSTNKSISVNNPTNYVSQPIIIVNGTGAVTLTVNGKPFYIKNVIDTITLSCERQAAYQELVPGFLTPMNHQIASRDYPVLKPGANQITATGSVTQIYVEPRWRSLV
jgi:phage-related protein